jgi:hypothetical protein
MTKRIPIPRKIEDEVMNKSDHKCYCGKRGDEIHHIDGNNSNNDFDNLVLICHDHHDDASVKNGLKKRLNPRQIKQRRNELYRQNEEKKRVELQHYSKTLKKITDENLFRAALDASIIVEILKIKSAFFEEQDWEKKYKILQEIRIYSDCRSIRVSYETIQFLSKVADIALTSDIACSITFIASDFFPYPENSKEKKHVSEFSKIACDMAFAISYDALIHLENLSIASWGLSLFKDIYERAKRFKMPEIIDYVMHEFLELEQTLIRPERNDLENAKRLVRSFKDDLGKRGIYPKDLPEDLYNLIQDHGNKSNLNLG